MAYTTESIKVTLQEALKNADLTCQIDVEYYNPQADYGEEVLRLEVDYLYKRVDDTETKTALFTIDEYDRDDF
jgi:hypothetical protein